MTDLHIQIVGESGLDATADPNALADAVRHLETRTLSARGAVDAQVSSAIYEMGAASALLPLMCLVAAVTRWWRTR